MSHTFSPKYYLKFYKLKKLLSIPIHWSAVN